VHQRAERSIAEVLGGALGQAGLVVGLKELQSLKMAIEGLPIAD
jgi:hypothetical protein